MDKKEFRIRQRNSLAKFAQSSEKVKEDQILFRKFIQLEQVQKAKKIGITASMPLEIDTSKIIAYLWDAGKEVFLAKVEPGVKHEMNFLRYDSNTPLKESKFGVLEVADENAEINNDLDLLLVPGLAYAENNHFRLGFGGGYYDRFLEKHPNIDTVSLANSKMLFKDAQWPVDKFDIPIQTLVTATETIKEGKIDGE